MSLVVAQTTEAGPRIVSDTRVGFGSTRRPSFKTGTLKAVVVAPAMTVCFAGDVAVGLDGVRHFAKCLSAAHHLDDLLPHLQRLTSDTRRRVEFIVARAEAGSTLIRVRDGEIEQNRHSAWIGDHRAFERFQEARHGPVEREDVGIMNVLSPDIQVMHILDRAMEAVIGDPSVSSVDDFCIRVAAKQGAFNYLGQTFIHVGRDLTIRHGDDLITKMAQPVSEGGYAVSVVEPALPGTPALGLNFPRARFGMVYLPLEYDEAQVITNVSPNDFAKAVFDRFGVAMSEPLLRHR
jgi:hypothetical protein